MFVAVHNPSDVPSGNKGSCLDLVSYLDKDSSTTSGFFDATSEGISPFSVVDNIDSNVQALGRNDAKFYMLSINPSHKELCDLIGRDYDSCDPLTEREHNELEEALIGYTRKSMDAYALNFGRDKIKSGEDLLYYARIETSRIYKPTHENISSGVRIGSEKPGLNYHVHVVVSRKSRDGKSKLSPQVVSRGNDWVLNGRVVKRGFNHERWKEECQEVWNRDYSYSLNAYIDREDSISQSFNLDLNEIVQKKVNSEVAVIQEMQVIGYRTRSDREGVWFTKGNERFRVLKKDIRARLSSFTKEEKISLYKRVQSGRAEVRPMIVHYMDRETKTWKAREDYYIIDRDNILRYRDAEMAYAQESPRDYVLGKLPEDIRAVYDGGEVYSYVERFGEIRDLGYTVHQNKGITEFEFDGGKVSIRNSELKAINGVGKDTLKDIASRIDIGRVEALKESYPKQDGVSIELRTIEGKDGRKTYYVVCDEVTNSVVKLSDVQKVLGKSNWDTSRDSLARSECPDIRQLSGYRYTNAHIFLQEMSLRGYEVDSSDEEVFIFSKDGDAYEITKSHLFRRVKDDRELERVRLNAWGAYQSGEAEVRDFEVSYVNSSGETQHSSVSYIVDDKNKSFVQLHDALKSWRESATRSEILKSLPDDFREALSGEYYSFREKIDDIAKLGYREEAFGYGTYHFVHEETGQRVHIRCKDLMRLEGVSLESKQRVLESVDLKTLYRQKEMYTRDGISVEARTIPNGVRYYVVKDNRHNVVVKLSDLKKLWEQQHRIPFRYGSHYEGNRVFENLSRRLVHQTLSPVAPVIQVAQFVSNPVASLKAQVMSQIKNILFSSFKSI